MRIQPRTVAIILIITIIGSIMAGVVVANTNEHTESSTTTEPSTTNPKEIDSTDNPSNEHSLDFATNSENVNMYIRFHYGMFSNIPEGGDMGISVVGVFNKQPIVGTIATVGYEGGTSLASDSLTDRLKSTGFVYMDIPILGVNMSEEIDTNMKPSSEGYNVLDEFETKADKTTQSVNQI